MGKHELKCQKCNAPAFHKITNIKITKINWFWYACKKHTVYGKGLRVELI